jgi:hypothetical protein
MSYDYQKEIDKDLVKAGFNVKELTQEQKDQIVKPTECPEDYWHDGEIEEPEAHDCWVWSMERVGLNRNQISLAIKMNK